MLLLSPSRVHVVSRVKVDASFRIHRAVSVASVSTSALSGLHLLHLHNIEVGTRKTECVTSTHLLCISSNRICGRFTSVASLFVVRSRISSVSTVFTRQTQPTRSSSDRHTLAVRSLLRFSIHLSASTDITITCALADLLASSALPVPSEQITTAPCSRSNIINSSPNFKSPA
jgi:hypothetical protein